MRLRFCSWQPPSTQEPDSATVEDSTELEVGFIIDEVRVERVCTARRDRRGGRSGVMTEARSRAIVTPSSCGDNNRVSRRAHSPAAGEGSAAGLPQGTRRDRELDAPSFPRLQNPQVDALLDVAVEVVVRDQHVIDEFEI